MPDHNFVDLAIIYALVTPTAVLYWCTTETLLKDWVGDHRAMWIMGFCCAAALHYLHYAFRSNAPTSSFALTVYETTYDYFNRLICVCYYFGCRIIYEFLLGRMQPLHVAILAAFVLLLLSSFRNVLKLPMQLHNDNTIDRYRPPSTLTFHSGIRTTSQLIVPYNVFTAFI